LPEGFVWGEPQWEVDVRPGEKISLNGTVQQVYAQLKEINPNWEEDNAEQIAAGLAALEEDNLTLTGGLAKREHDAIARLEKRDHNECGGWNHGAYRYLIEDGIRYLWGLNGRARISNGQCDRVSCSYDAAIWWCGFVNPPPCPFYLLALTWIQNANTVEIDKGLQWIGHGANVLINDQNCNWYDYMEWTPRVSGRRYHDNHVAVYVGYSAC
jgi:hypothetical protein